MEVPFLYEIVIIFLLSIVVTIVCNRLKLPATVGFLLTGVLCGPSLLGIVSNREAIDQVADIGVAMNSGTQAAREAGNMVDLDSDPTKLIEIIEIGKQLIMTRGALTTFSIANDVAKYFAIIPAMFMLAIPQLSALNVMGLASPQSAVLSALIFNAIIIPLLIPIAIRGVKYRPRSAESLLRHNLLVYGLGGILLPFAGIKLIDMLLAGLGLA